MKQSNDIILASSGLQKNFQATDGAINVLDGVDFKLHHGDSVSIRGESGCGKSTLLNVLSGLDRADAGKLFWRNQDVSGYSISKFSVFRAKFMGFIFQGYYLAPELNVIENVLLGARIVGQTNQDARERAEALLIRVGLKDRISHSSLKLSGGERQRVAVARALINDPPLVMADEPTGNLDESTGHAVMDLLLDIADESAKSLILVTHNTEFAERTKRQLILHFGKLSDA